MALTSIPSVSLIGAPLGAGHIAHVHILRLRDSSTVLLGARGLRDEVPLGTYWLNTGLL